MGSLLPGVSLPSLQQKRSIPNPKINMNKEVVFFIFFQMKNLVFKMKLGWPIAVLASCTN